MWGDKDEHTQLSLPTGLRSLCYVRSAVGTGTKVAHIPNPIPDSSHVSRIGGQKGGLSSEGRTEMKGMGACCVCKHSGPGLTPCQQAALLERISCRAAEAFISVLPAEASSVGVWR